ncbi:MAG TPA: SpoIVB peptidase S55 domain-containing protein [bacterium]|nr:SpoIVB peptidase S55 domain-containing protein [bacterium]
MSTAVRVARWCAVLVVGGFVSAVPLAASPSLIPADQITPGMTGIGKTVILGTRISEFAVTILGVLRNAGPAGDLVLFRASGPVIRDAGGLASGMSGSPIYLGGKLAGAFSYSFQFADPTVGLFTPIEDMMKTFSTRARGARPGVYAVAPFSLGGRTIRRVRIQPTPDPRPAAPDMAVAVPAATPLFVSGLGAQVTEEMTHALQPMGLLPLAGPGTADLPSTIPLEPGSAIGVSLMQGDIAAFAIGTLTYRDGNRVLAFGHPFTELGATEFLLTNATILQTVRAVNHNLKIGAAGAPVGIISEDRPAAVGGTIGVFPRMFGVRVTVSDADAGASRRFGFQVVGNKDLAPILVALGTRGAVERALNRSGEGTAEVRMVLRGRALPRQVERANNFYSGSDISVRALAEVPQALHLLFDNDFVDVSPTDITIDVKVTKARQTGTITEAEFPRGTLQPGGTARVRVTVRPFREAPMIRDIDVAVPADFPEGSAQLVVRGGSSAPPIAPGGLTSTGQGPAAIRNLADAISAFEGGEKNTDVVVDLISGAQRPPLATTAGPPHVSTRWTTPWVLVGRFQTPIVITRGAR